MVLSNNPLSISKFWKILLQMLYAVDYLIKLCNDKGEEVEIIFGEWLVRIWIGRYWSLECLRIGPVGREKHFKLKLWGLFFKVGCVSKKIE